MRVRITRNRLSAIKADLAVCFAFEGDKAPRGVEDAALRRELAKEMRAEKFAGQPGDHVVWNTNGRYGTNRFVVVGLGTGGGAPGEAIRAGSARAARAAARFAATRLALRLPDGADVDEALEARAAIEGALFGSYQFDRYLSDPKRLAVRPTSIEVAVQGRSRALNRAAELAQSAARAVYLARDLVNEAPSRMTPREMARVATAEAKRVGLGCKVLGAAELKKLGMSALLAVARGSQEPPRVVHLHYKPGARGSARRVVLVGKGVTFDSGGLNLKSGDSMLAMKSDMAGAATVLATLISLKQVGCPVEVHGVLGLTENMTGAGAYKPGDILDTYAGKTVEVGNTDAEGRLVLADLLAWASAKLRPTEIVDVATLTGACVVALGTMATGLFTRHESLRDGLVQAASMAGEKIWPMPMYEEYLQLLQKGPADLHNIGGRWGGAITAALFLGEFVPRDIPWVHLDIAGPAFTETDLPEARPGATGACVGTLLRWLESR